MRAGAAGTTDANLFAAFQKSQDNLIKAQGALDAATNAGDEAEIFKAQQEIQKQTRIMSALSNISQTVHNMLMRLIDKLNIRV